MDIAGRCTHGAKIPHLTEHPGCPAWLGPTPGFPYFWGNIRPVYSFIAQLPISTSAGWWRLGGELPVFVPFAPAEAADEARILQAP